MANVNGTAIYSHEAVGCGTYFSGNKYVTGMAISAYDRIGCPFTLGIHPDAMVEPADTDLVYSVWTDKGRALILDDATVDFVAKNIDGVTYIVKSTDDYSIIAYDSTLVVHICSGDVTFEEPPLYYTATITTADDAVYSMTGRLIVTKSPTVLCFNDTLPITARRIPTTHAMQREPQKLKALHRTPTTCDAFTRASKVLPAIMPDVPPVEAVRRTSASIPCFTRTIHKIPITQREIKTVKVAPCGKRRS